MKIIGIAALAIALSAFAARAQTTTTIPSTGDNKDTAVLPADQNSSALPGNSSNTASSNKTLPSNDPKANGTPAGDLGAKTSQTQPDDKSTSSAKTASPNNPTTSGTDTGSSGSVARPPAPDTSVDQKPTKDPGMSSRPGDVTGQPTDTQKPVDTAPSSNPPKDR